MAQSVMDQSVMLRSTTTAPLVVVGDTLLDVDLVGDAGRLSPDAPVPVLDSLVEWPRPGGAGLAAMMAARHGGEVVLVTALGGDAAGDKVRRLLSAAGVEVVALPYDGPTPVKKRVRSGGQTLVRLDSGTEAGVVTAVPDRVEEVLADAGAVLVADYGRGVSAVPGVRRLLEAAARRRPVVWDPHPRGTSPVPGVRLVTPNEDEAARFAEELGVELPADPPTHQVPLTAVGRRADALVESWQAHAVAVTLGARGALLSYGRGAPAVVPAPSIHCVDPCGAGDRFASAVAAGLAGGRVLAEAVEDAVVAAADYVAAGGPASLGGTSPGPAADHTADHTDGDHDAAPRRTVADLITSVRAGGGTVVATGGCFDLLHAGHVATLRAARSLGDCLVVCLNSDASVRRLKGETRPLVPAADRAQVLEALDCVDAVVVFDEDTPDEAIRGLRPDVWAKGGDYVGADLPEAAVLREWGGQAVVLPYLEGRSTTRLVASATRQQSETAGRQTAGPDAGRRRKENV